MEKQKKEKSTGVVVTPPQSQVMLQGEALIKQGIDKGVSVETMEKLLAMRRELKAEYAKEQFDFAMANFQSAVPTIKKTKAGGSTNSGVVAYKFAPIDSIVEQIKDALKENGFSYKFDTETTETGVSVTCTAKHKDGHSESSSIAVPLGAKTQVMSAPQVVASAITFAKRYSLCNVFGIVTGDEDNDANIKTPEEPGNAAAPAAAAPKGPTDPAKTVDALFEKAKKNLAGNTDKVKLADYRKKIDDSVKYSPEQKAELFAIIDGIINKK